MLCVTCTAMAATWATTTHRKSTFGTAQLVDVFLGLVRLFSGLVLADNLVLGAHALQHVGSFGGKLTLHADGLAVFVEQEREGHASNG
ncbi:hypothetical protein HG530_003402 [Fusarium avenaceum]|nr:hypothetical protein HG530_003402 [Fusarium avenaceum]